MSKISNKAQKVNRKNNILENPEGEISNDDLKAEISQITSSNKIGKKVGIFKIRTANECVAEASGRPIPKMLFGEIWHEGELCILFGDTGTGKSILAVQIANSITTNKKVYPFKLTSQKHQVLYFDFELSDKQFQIRYSDPEGKNFYIFSDFFNRVEISVDTDLPEKVNFEDFLIYSLEEAVKATDAKVLIIDNITYLAADQEKARYALVLMKKLKHLKEKYGLSILALAHTPKRDPTKEISRNDLAGSKMLINFCDSAFAIGESYRHPGARYFKQIKERNTDKIYGRDNVVVFEVEKGNHNFLGFSFVDFSDEREHLKTLTDSEEESIMNDIEHLHDNGYSIREIAKELRIPKGRVERRLKKIKESIPDFSVPNRDRNGTA